ncbi:uncharacterized protein LOC124115313 [Haliotis rufescens]|uniref:uncharacterized protein LOC124115313 n=1 Tax=Haliotis rufescens TaxID=6454 RepID=UPI00201F216D|nr:uncharacterized protein LOC124115313 [Haliotis rufescens]
MSWDFNRHHAAKKVLAKHMDDLDRKQASICNRRDESLRDLQRELISLQSVSTPDLGKGLGSPRTYKKSQHNFNKDSSKYLILPPAGRANVSRTPPYTQEPDASFLPLASRLLNRRQSEPVAVSTQEASDLQQLMRKALNLSEERPDESWNRVLESTLPGAENTGANSRLTKRRGTIALTEGIHMMTSKNKSHLHTDSSMAEGSKLNKVRPRRGSLPVNSLSLNVIHEPSRGASARSRKGTDTNTQAKRTFGKKTKRGSHSKSAKSFKEQRGVSVMFYNEETGEESIPAPLPVIPGLKEDGDGRPEADETGSVDDNDEKEGMWDEVAKCRYIRGYDPPEMRIPDEDSATYVFGRSYNDVFHAQDLQPQ